MRTAQISSSLRAIGLVAVLVVFVGCATERSAGFFFEELHGIVRDDRGEPLAGVRIYIGPLHQAVSDSHGRFTFSQLPPGEHTVIARSPGHEDAVTNLQFMNRTQLIQITLVSLTELTEQALSALYLGYLERAGEVLRRMEYVDPTDARTVLVAEVLSTMRQRRGL